MTESTELEQRLADYGQVLSAELAGWPVFNPATVAASSPLLFYRGWRGRWSGAGHRPFLAVAVVVTLAAAATVAILLSLTTDQSAPPDTEAPVGIAAPIDPEASAEAGEPTSDPLAAPSEQAPQAEPVSPAPTAEIDDTEPPAEPAATDGGSDPEVGAAGDPNDSVPSARCRDGLLVNGDCRIARPVANSARSAACLAQAGMLRGETGGDATQCFKRVDAVASCPGTAEQSGFVCFVRSAPRPAVPPCPTGAVLSGQRCVRTLVAKLVCVDGELVDDLCRVEQAPAQGGELSCTGGAVTDGRCTIVVAGTCSSGTPVSGGCAQSAPTEKRTSCPTDTVLNDGRCQPIGGCQNTKDSRICGSPPIVEVICSLTGQRGDCTFVVPATCPANFAWNGSDCAREAAAAPAPFQCPPGEMLVGTSCFVEVMPEPECAEGILVEAESETAETDASEGSESPQLLCAVSTPAAAPVSTCPVGSSLEAGRCVSAFGADRICAMGTLIGDECEIIVEIAGAALCSAGELFEYGWCVRFEAPISS